MGLISIVRCLGVKEITLDKAGGPHPISEGLKNET